MRIKVLPNKEVVMHVRDITEKQKLIKKIKTDEARFRLIVENLSIPTTLSNLNNHEVLYVNPAASKFWGVENGKEFFRENLQKIFIAIQKIEKTLFKKSFQKDFLI